MRWTKKGARPLYSAAFDCCTVAHNMAARLSTVAIMRGGWEIKPPIPPKTPRPLPDLLYRRLPHGWRVPLLSKKTPPQKPHSGARRPPVQPVLRDIAFDARHQLRRNDPQRRFTHHLPRALVLSERVVERDFFVRETRLLAAPAGRPDVPLRHSGLQEPRTVNIGSSQ